MSSGLVVSNHIITEVVLLHLHNTALETALSSPLLHTDQITHQQQKYLNVGIESIISWFDVFFTMPPAAYDGFPFSIFSQLLRCLMTLYQLRSLPQSAWDDELWKAIDPLLIIDRVINNMEQVVTTAGVDNTDDPDDDIFSQGAQMCRSLRPRLEAVLRPDDTVLSTPPAMQTIDEALILDSFGMEFFANDWLTNALLQVSQPVQDN